MNTNVISVLLLLVATLGCGTDNITRPPDVEGPTVSAVWSENRDTNGDNLLDFKLSWFDSAGVNYSSLRMRVLGQASSRDMTAVWKVVPTADGAMVSETIGGLLPAGPVQLEIEIEDSLGNRTRRLEQFSLPAVAFHKTIRSQREWNGRDHGTTAIICEDRRVYVTVGNYLSVIDADSVNLIAEVLNPYAVDAMYGATCINQPASVYVAQKAQKFDRNALIWPVSGTGLWAASSIANSRVQRNKLYIGLDRSGGISIYDIAAEREVRVIAGTRNSSGEEYVFDLAVMPNDEKLYATRLSGGIAVIDTAAGITNVIKVAGSWSYGGRVDDIELSPDSRHLYAAVADGEVRGIAVIDATSGKLLKNLPVPNSRPQVVAVSPSGKRLFVGTQDLTGPSENYVIDSETGAILSHFPRPRTADVRWDGGVVFHPSGKLIFAARDIHVDVYLNRE